MRGSITTLVAYISVFGLLCGLAVERLRKNPIFLKAGTIYEYLS
jgi:hypothetical protein